jgi:hypothetical protein
MAASIERHQPGPSIERSAAADTQARRPSNRPAWYLASPAKGITTKPWQSAGTHYPLHRLLQAVKRGPLL